MTDTTITIIGNLTEDPNLRFTPSGVPVASFTVASTPRIYDKQAQQWVDGEPLFLGCSVWQQAGENAAESLRKGMRVIVTGRLRARSYETREGQRRTVFEVEVEEVGPSLRWATADVRRTGQPEHRPTARQQPQSARQPADPWATQAHDLPPF